MSVDQNQTVDAEAQAETAATPVDATVQAETPETPAPVAPKKRATTTKAVKAAETPAPAAETPVVETPVVETPALTPAPAAETLALTPAPAAETPAPAAATPEVAPAPAETPAQAPATGFVWGAKRKAKQTEVVDQACEITVTNTGAHSFESYTRTPLPPNKAVVITCESQLQRAAIINKLTKLNQLSGATRYVIEG